MKKPIKRLPSLVLASASQRRRRLLDLAGFHLRVLPSKIDEEKYPHETAVAYVKRLALAKAMAIWPRMARHHRATWILGADTAVVLPSENRVLGKARNRNEARRFLQRLSGHPHDVLTAFCLLHYPTKRKYLRLVRSRVIFRSLRPHEIEAYLDTGEWRDKAGACCIQGHGAILVDSISGSYTNVVGLPIREVLQALRMLEEKQR